MVFSKAVVFCIVFVQMTICLAGGQDLVYSEDYKTETYSLCPVSIDNYIEPTSEIAHIHGKGWVIELYNGSMWRATDPGSAKIINSWSNKGYIVIYPELLSCDIARFRCMNTSTREIANIECFLGSSRNPLVISIILPHEGELFLWREGKSVYRDRYKCRDTLKNFMWCVGDSLILLSNRGSHTVGSSCSDYVLYNFRTDEMIEANLVR